MPATLFALGTTNNLLRLDSATPGTVTTTAVTGLNTGETLVGIDVRPATGELYAIGTALTGGGTASTNQISTYAINPATGAAVLRGTATVANITGASAFGFDFNPTVDRIRVTTDLASDGNGANTNVNNFRLNPNDGSLTAIDPDLDATALPNGAGDLPETGVAYTNNFDQLNTVAAANRSTTLFGIVFGSGGAGTGDRLVTNGGTAPGFQTLTNVGSLGVVTDSRQIGFDIFGQTNTALASLSVGGVFGLYSINLTTGAATRIGTLGNGTTAISDIAIAGLTPTTVGGSTNGQVRLLTSSTGQTTAGTTSLGQLTAGPTVTAFSGLNVNVRTATADVNGDQIEDIIAVTGPGTPVRVTVISGADNTTVLVAPFDPFEGFTGGGYVAAGDFNGDGRAEFVVTPDQGGGPRVSIYSLPAGQTTPTRLANYFTIDANFRGGARVAVGRVNQDATPDLLIAAGFGGGPRVVLINGTRALATDGFTASDRLVPDFFVFEDVLRNGVYAAIGDVNGDGFGDLIFGAGPGGGPRVLVVSGQTLLNSGAVAAVGSPLFNFFVAGSDSDRGGVRVSTNDLDGDNRADVVVGTGEGRPSRVRAYLGKNFTAGTGTTAGTEPTVFQDVDPFSATLADGVYVG